MKNFLKNYWKMFGVFKTLSYICNNKQTKTLKTFEIMDYNYFKNQCEALAKFQQVEVDVKYYDLSD